MKQLDWTIFKKRIAINVSEEEIFNAWTKQINLEKWFLNKAEFSNKDKNKCIKKDDTYTWMWHGSDNVAKGIVLATNNKNYIEFTFLGCEVSVEIKTEAGETIVEIIQKKIPLDEQSRMDFYVGCSRGWTFYLTNLKSILEGGIDLRNKNKNLINVVNT